MSDDPGRDMLLDLTDEETLALHDLLNTTIEAARYPVSPRIRMLRGTLTKLRLTARVLERRTPVKAEAVGAAAAELDRRELARELQSVPTGGDLNRQVLERQLCESGPEGAVMAWQRVEDGLRAERVDLDRLRDELPTDPYDALSWASELCRTVANWCAWETVRLRAEGHGGRTWAALEVAEADLREKLERAGDSNADSAHGGLIADCWMPALKLVLGELHELLSAHRAAVVALYARARRAGIA